MGQGLCFLADFYFLSSVLFSVYGRHQYRHCMRRKLGPKGEERGKGFKVGAVQVEQALFLSTNGLRYRPGRDHV